MRKFLFALLCAISPFLPAQISFFSVPADLQMFPRVEAVNSGSFLVSGQCNTENVVAVRSVLRENGADTVIELYEQRLGSERRFDIIHHVPARLSEFSLYIYEVDTKDEALLVKKVQDLVAGDFFVIAGQSNAEAPGNYDAYSLQFDSLYSLPSCRAIGASFAWATAKKTGTAFANLSIEEDCIMGRPSCHYAEYGKRGFVNTWGLKLQYQLALSSGIPNCFVNAAQGGRNIIECSPSQTPSDPQKLRHSSQGSEPALPYDRTYRKLHLNNALSGVKAVFWNQGESDAALDADTAARYGAKFASLYKAWETDFPALKKVFVMQVSIGCGGAHLRSIAEIQRNLPKHHSKVVLMSTVGFSYQERTFDHCHFTYKGYEALAEKLYPLCFSHLYGSEDPAPRTLAPDVKRIYYANLSMINVEFDQDVFVQQQTLYPEPVNKIAFMRDNFFMQNGIQLQLDSVSFSGNTVHLFTKISQSPAKVLTYLPANYPPFASIFAGPWIVNARNDSIGALCFSEFPVEKFSAFQSEEDFLISPNPADKEISVFFSETTSCNLVVLDTFGKEWVHTSVTDKDKIQIDLSVLPFGLYWISIPERGLSKKFLKL